MIPASAPVAIARAEPTAAEYLSQFDLRLEAGCAF
jgi:hypothetical protein